ncbi:hypothetical protein LXL04_018550 [Taraxacum kok-saghyz]
MTVGSDCPLANRTRAFPNKFPYEAQCKKNHLNLNPARNTSVITYAFSFGNFSLLSPHIFLTWRNSPTARVCMMNSGSGSNEPAADLCNEPNLDLESWINELYSADFRDPLMNFGLEEIMTAKPNYTYQPHINTVNNGPFFGGSSSSDKSQCGILNELMTVSNSTHYNSNTSTFQSNSTHYNSNTSTYQTSGHLLSPIPQFISTSVSSSSITCKTTVMIQSPNHNQRFKQPMVSQNTPTYTTTSQPTILFGQNSNSQQMTLDQIRPCSRPVSTIQASHLQNQMVHQSQNQSQMQFQFQQTSGTSNRVQGVVINEGHRRTQEQRERYISEHLSAEVGFLRPSEFASSETWCEYAFRQIVDMRKVYVNELLKMHKRANQLCVQETNPEIKTKYANAKEFLEKMVTFLNIPSVDMIPKHKERVYNYMNFIVNYLTSFRNKNGGLYLNFDQIDISQGFVINLDTNMMDFNQQSVQHPGSSSSSSSQSRPPVQPNVDVMRSQSMAAAPLTPNQRIPNREASMMNFNQNFPSRKPQMRMQNGSFQLGSSVNNPIRIGGQSNGVGVGQTHRSNLGPKTASSNHTHVNVSSSSMSLLKAATSAVNFQSTRQYNHQPSTRVNVNQSFNSDKMKQPMYKSTELTGSATSHVLSPLGEILKTQFRSPQPTQKPIILKPTTQHSVSSWGVNANNVLSPQSIARSTFLNGGSSSQQYSSMSSSSQHQQYSYSGLSSVSSVENQLKEIPVISGLLRDQRIVKNQVSNMGTPRTPMASPPCKEKGKESQTSKDPHVRLMDAIKSSNKLSSSINDIDSVQHDLDSIPAHYTKPIGGDKENRNFFLKYDDMDVDVNFDSMFDVEPPNLDHLNIGEETAFLFSHEKYEPEQKVKRKISATSASRSVPEFSDYDFDRFFNDEWDIDSTETSMNKKAKIESKNVAILEAIKEFNSKLLETSLEMVEGNEGIIVNCIYRNVCFPDLFKLQEGVSSQMRPEFRIKLLVPVDYPTSSPTILKGSYCNVLSAPWPKLYEETMSNFNRAVRELPNPMSLGGMAREWDACARSVIIEFAQKRGGKSFSTKYGNWESSSSGSN